MARLVRTLEFGGLSLAVFWKRGRALPVVAGMLLSLGVMTAIQALPKWGVTRELWARVVGPEIFWPWYTLMGAVVTIGTAWLMGRKTKENVLQEVTNEAKKIESS